MAFSILTSISLSDHHALSSPLPKYVNDVTSTMKIMVKYEGGWLVVAIVRLFQSTIEEEICIKIKEKNQIQKLKSVYM